MRTRSVSISVFRHSVRRVRDRGFPTIDDCRQLHDACEEESLLGIEDRAFIAFGHKDYREAACCFECLRRRGGEIDDSALFTYGLCLKKLGREDAALEMFEQVITGGRICHYDILAAFEKAEILKKRSRTGDAMDALQRARAQDRATFEKHARYRYRHLWDLISRMA